jgi:hypothetical protein
MTDTTKTYKIPAENLASLQERIEQVNKRVARLVKKGYDAKPVVIEVSPLYAEKQPCGCAPSARKDCHHCLGGGFKPDRVFADVTLTAPEAPKANGWEFVAALTHVEGVGTVLRVVPGVKVEEGELARYREASPDNCDHCNAKRRRLDTFVLRKVG